MIGPKHGSRGSGEDGPCEPDCRKCVEEGRIPSICECGHGPEIHVGGRCCGMQTCPPRGQKMGSCPCEHFEAAKRGEGPHPSYGSPEGLKWDPADPGWVRPAEPAPGKCGSQHGVDRCSSPAGHDGPCSGGRAVWLTNSVERGATAPVNEGVPVARPIALTPAEWLVNPETYAGLARDLRALREDEEKRQRFADALDRALPSSMAPRPGERCKVCGEEAVLAPPPRWRGTNYEEPDFTGWLRMAYPFPPLGDEAVCLEWLNLCPKCAARCAEYVAYMAAHPHPRDGE